MVVEPPKNYVPMHTIFICFIPVCPIVCHACSVIEKNGRSTSLAEEFSADVMCYNSLISACGKGMGSLLEDVGGRLGFIAWVTTVSCLISLYSTHTLANCCDIQQQ